MSDANVYNALARVMEAQNKLTAAVEALNAAMRHPATHDAPTFAQVAHDLAAGDIDRYMVGDIIRARHQKYGEIPFVIIGKGQDNEPDGTGTERITAQAMRVLDYVQYSRVSDEYPYGKNDYVASSVRAYLNGAFYDALQDDDRAAIVGALKRTYTPNYDDMREPGYIAQTRELFFLLSASEAGFEGRYIMDEGPAYAYFKGCDNERRVKTDMDGDESFWWLRSPYPSDAYNVRDVYTSGALSSSLAGNGSGLAPACVIGA